VLDNLARLLLQLDEVCLAEELARAEAGPGELRPADQVGPAEELAPGAAGPGSH
jgi:hypothetical protein